MTVRAGFEAHHPPAIEQQIEPQSNHGRNFPGRNFVQPFRGLAPFRGARPRESVRAQRLRCFRSLGRLLEVLETASLELLF